MKKILLVVSLFFLGNCFTVKPVYAETGIEVLRACAAAMNFDKLDEFNTLRMRASLLVQGQRVGMRIMSKDDNLRFEQTMQGRDEAFVLTAEEEFFRVKPHFELLRIEDAAQIVSTVTMLLPSMMLNAIIKSYDENEENLIIELIGVEDFNRKPSKKVRVAAKELPANAPPEAAEGSFYYFDPITNWLVGIDLTPQQSLVFERKKRLQGYVYPTVIKLMVNGRAQLEFEISRMEADMELNDSLFARP